MIVAERKRWRRRLGAKLSSAIADACRSLKARASANRLVALDPGVPSGRTINILNERRPIGAATAFRLGRYFGNRPQFWLDLQSQYDRRA